MGWVREICSDPDCTYVFHNAMYDIGWLRAEGVEVKGPAPCPYTMRLTTTLNYYTIQTRGVK